MILVDSSVLIDYFNGIDNFQTVEFDKLLDSEIIIGDYILAEVLRGFRNKNDFNTARRILSNFPCYSLCSPELAVKSALNYRFLIEKGITIRKTVDIIIGTFCIENKVSLLHNDKDFKPMQRYLGLKVIGA